MNLFRELMDATWALMGHALVVFPEQPPVCLPQRDGRPLKVWFLPDGGPSALPCLLAFLILGCSPGNGQSGSVLESLTCRQSPKCPFRIFLSSQRKPS